MKSQSRKSKGREFQKHLKKMIIEAFPDLEEDDVISCSMGNSGVDLQLSPLAQKVFPISIEAKNTKAQPGSEAVKQAEANIYEATFPVVAWKPPRKNMNEAIAYIKFSDLLSLIKRIRSENASKKEE